ncbi:hypothetical protein [Gimesia maris]|uniref:Uncharacterized protein n=1 Tax=Gimesia maris TaxID=122 RepID=A0ABX5YSR8_9PLAN|nr:hypothetical protein [Gimesia maris]EDL60181.1 hypothetical protein PM8797T_20568 [Gimesia maris DSM 8797]QEG18703.1 hypothetical protein GmarT_45930 [Gimesia maris]QGQ28354.1 hypothetical protein F1729_06675 [Gimesia maris]
MQRLFCALVIWGSTCIILHASEGHDSIYKLDVLNVSAPDAVVVPLICFPEQPTAETPRERNDVDVSLLFQAQSVPLLPFYESYDASQFYDRMRYLNAGLECVMPRKKHEETKLAAADGAFTISKKLEAAWERLKSDYQESEEKYRLLNLYYGARYVDRP